MNTERNLSEEQQIFIGQLVKKGIEHKSTEAKIATLKEDIESSKKQVTSFQQAVASCVEEIGFLSTIREKMARTAS